MMIARDISAGALGPDVTLILTLRDGSRRRERLPAMLAAEFWRDEQAGRQVVSGRVGQRVIAATFSEWRCPRCGSIYHITPVDRRGTYDYEVESAGAVNPALQLPHWGRVSGDAPFCIFDAATLVMARPVMATTANGRALNIEMAGQG
jgi:hypothetical protein